MKLKNSIFGGSINFDGHQINKLIYFKTIKAITKSFEGEKIDQVVVFKLPGEVFVCKFN